jgi:recombination protein RecA
MAAPTRKRGKKVKAEAAEAAPAKAAPAPANELAAVLADIRKNKGENSVLPASQIPIANHIPTGSFILDFALLGGIPEGFPTMIYGLESSGKTTILKKVVGCFQRKHPDKQVVWIDSEGMFDPQWATQLGVDLDRLLVHRPETGQEAVDVMEAMMGAWETGMVVLDSIPGCVPFNIIQKSAEDMTMTELARLMGVMCSKLTASYQAERKRGHFVTNLFVNQFRFKVGGLVLGDPRTLPGGRQINHIPTTKIEIKNKEEHGKDRYDNDVVEHNAHEFKITKAKHGSSIRSGEFRMMINPDNADGVPQGTIDDADTVCVYAKKMGMLTGGGAAWRVDGIDRKFGNIASIVTHLRETPEEYVRLCQQVIAAQRQSKGLPLLPPDGYLLDWAEAS